MDYSFKNYQKKKKKPGRYQLLGQHLLYARQHIKVFKCINSYCSQYPYYLLHVADEKNEAW